MDPGGRRTLKFLLPALLIAGCGPTLSEEELLDPQTCMECHPDHYREWSGSMHAYAAEDPVFLAMNQRGQEETNGELGDFCIDCHAPMAVKLGLTEDGTNLDDVPDHLEGVTCYYCHQTEAVEGTHNNPLVIAADKSLRGGIPDPVANPHRAAYSPLHDGDDLASSDLCGSCHDIITPAGVHLERTFAEWQASIFAVDFVGSLSCVACHMPSRSDVAADVDGVPVRRVHNHMFPGVDTALTEFPESDAQAQAVGLALDGTVQVQLCARDDGAGATEIEMLLDNIGAGHSFPSGASQDRRVWVELTAYQADAVVFSTGDIAPDTAVAEVEATDPNLWLLRDRMFNADGDEVHMFWEAASIEAQLLSGPLAGNQGASHELRQWTMPAGVDRVTAQVHVRAMGREVLQSLVDSGHLQPSIADEIPTWTLAGTDEWTLDSGFDCDDTP